LRQSRATAPAPRAWDVGQYKGDDNTKGMHIFSLLFSPH
jgi:hypothetical protein